MIETNLPPNVSSLVKSLRDIGYTLDVAVADLIDNSVSANATNIDIVFAPINDKPILSILDDGKGMNFDELTESMRLATKDPSDHREDGDLGRFGLGLKTASFSQSKLLTVASKTENSEISVSQWDLDKVISTNKWILNQLDFNEIDEDTPLLKEFYKLNSGTLVVWGNIDKVFKEAIPHEVIKISNHLSLVFNRFLSGEGRIREIGIKLNNIKLEAFDPLDKENVATLFEEPTVLEINGKKVKVQGCILPSVKRTIKSVFERNATINGYLRSQGCYLYRSNRLIAYGTWWNLIKRHDSHNLVRIQVDIDNNQDEEWSVSVTKSGFSVTPPHGIRDDLRAVFKSATKVGRGVVGGRKRVVKNKVKIMFWDLVKYGDNGKFGYSINKEHSLYKKLTESVDNEQVKLLNLYLSELQKYLPVEDINRSLIHRPHDFDQRNSIEIDNVNLKNIIESFKNTGLSKEDIGRLLLSEGIDQELFEL
jgi:hypothetical protein